MRISTSGITNSALFNIVQQQAQLSKTQSQVATGKRVQSPADDPIAAVHILELQRALSESEQFSKNADAANNRLVLEEQALQDIGHLIQSVQERAVQGNTASISAADRKLIATEVRERLTELVDIANRRDANGEFLFSGYATRTQPFAQNGSGVVTYFGDQGSRQLQVGPNQRITDSHSGYEVFIDAAEGNGTFVTRANAANTGTGVIAAGSVVNPTQYVADDYTLRFNSATSYDVLDGGGAVISSGTYTQNSAISFRGISVNVTGAPAANDTFAVDRSRTEDLFTTLGTLANALEATTVTPADRAQFNSTMAQVLTQLDTAQDGVLNVRAEVGSRLASLETSNTARAEAEVELQRITSELQDVDYAEAITRMNQQLVGLQAAQQSYSRISQLSLFDYLR